MGLLDDLKKQAEDLKSSVSDLTSFDPMASTKKEIESAFVMPEVATAAPATARSRPALPAAAVRAAHHTGTDPPA